MARVLKDSGIEWIKDIPTNWNISRLGGQYEHRNQKVSDKDYQALSVTKQGILLQLETVAKSDAHDDRKLVKKGDFVINSRSDRRGSCGISDYDGSVSLINTVLKPRTEMSPRYYNWLFHTMQFADEFYKWGHGIVDDLWTTRWQDMKKITIPFPPIDEQNKIADYLDRKCGEIDAITAEIQEQINTLEEYKKSVITKVVIQGINATSKMKKCNIEWINEIPENWKTSRIGVDAWIRARLGWKGLRADEYEEEGHPFLSAFNIINNKICWNKIYFINDFRYNESPEIKLNIGDIVLVKDGAGIGKCAIIQSLPYNTATTNGSLAVITTYKKLNSLYLYYYLQSAIFQNFIIRMMNGMGVPHLSQEELRKIVIPLPPVEEQKEIAEYLNEKCIEIDGTISDKQKQIETLEEYKKTLIYEYVTGKKEVA